MTPLEPRIKASLVKSALVEIRRLPAKDLHSVSDRVAPGTFQVIDDAASLAWLPMVHQVELDHAVHEALGPQRLMALTRDWTRAATMTPLVAPVLRGTLSLFGSGSALVLKMFPRFWRMSIRDCGGMDVVIDGQGGTLTYTDLPPMLRSAPFVAASQGSVWGMVDLFNDGRGSVESDDSELAQGIVRHHFRFD